MLFIVHSGQTGVERGAHDAARAAGMRIAGFMPADERDELGLLSPHIVERLTCCPERGQRPPIKANVEIASAVLLVMPSAREAEQFPAMLWVIQRIRARRLPTFIADPTTRVSEVAEWVANLRGDSGSIRLLVTGPRATRWKFGEQVARKLVAGIAMWLDTQRASGDVNSDLLNGEPTCTIL